MSIKNSKTCYYINFFATSKSDMRRTWKGINSILSKKHKTDGGPTKLVVDQTACHRKPY